MFKNLRKNGGPFDVPMAEAAVQIGVMSFSLRVPVAERDLIQEISELYASYPAVGSHELTDTIIALSYPNLKRRFIGREITVFVDGSQPYNPWPPRLGVPLLESAINGWLGRNIARYLMVHAAVVERGGCAILLPGTSGAGKSTLSTVLSSRCWRLLSDEVAIIRTADGLVLPHPRPISLKNESIDMMEGRLPDAYLSKRYDGTTKGTVAFLRPPEDAIEKASTPAKPKTVVFPQFNPEAKTELKRLEKAPAFMLLIENSPQYFTLLETGFETLASLVERCEHYKLAYNDVDDAISLIESLELDDRDDKS
jgi:HprK-related kinase A